MKIKPIRNDDDLRAALRRLDAVFQAKVGTPEADEMEVLVTLIEAYENKHYPISPPDPVEAIKFRMEQQGLTLRAELESARSAGFALPRHQEYSARSHDALLACS